MTTGLTQKSSPHDESLHPKGMLGCKLQLLRAFSACKKGLQCWDAPHSRVSLSLQREPLQSSVTDLPVFAQSSPAVMSLNPFRESFFNKSQ